MTAEEALVALNELRSNVVSTQSASWSNMMYPLVAILDAAGMESFESSEEQMAQHISCYGDAGGYPGRLQAEPDDSARITAKNIERKRAAYFPREQAVRADVRETTIEAAAAERFANRCYVVLVSEAIVEELRDKWSPPVQITISTEGGIAEMTVREVSNTESKV